MGGVGGGVGGEVDFSSLNMPKPVIKSEILVLGTSLFQLCRWQNVAEWPLLVVNRLQVKSRNISLVLVAICLLAFMSMAYEQISRFGFSR